MPTKKRTNMTSGLCDVVQRITEILDAAFASEQRARQGKRDAQMPRTTPYTNMVFEAIINTAIKDAESVDCTTSQFVAGLREMLDILKDRLSLSEDELSSVDGDEFWSVE